MKNGDIKTEFDVEEKLRKSFGKIIKSMLEVEMDEHLGNSKPKSARTKGKQGRFVLYKFI